MILRLTIKCYRCGWYKIHKLGAFMNKKNGYSRGLLFLDSFSISNHNARKIIDFSVAKKNKDKSKKEKAIAAILKEAEQLTW